ncbi:MAG TPA: hypothetical protein IGR64_13865 [Leptolyngbyaceae cyanobacterium M65_K2018_010]|nr:hypothetical protein [Leptolyngbyaceae cyanobacterium M65_K2018_010]
MTTVLVNLAFVTGGLYGIYRSISHIAQQEVTLSMEETLEATLARIDGDKFAELTQVEVPPGQIEPIDNPLYQEHQKWLETVNWIAPKAYPATYIKGAKDNEMVAIGDVYRITNPEYDYPFKSVIPEDEVYPEMLEGFKQVTPILTPMENDYGSFVMIFGPIKNRAGQVVGALCLQYDSTYVTDIKDQIRRIMTIACTIALIWLVISSWLILQATRPPRELLAGGDGAASPPKDVALL